MLIKHRINNVDKRLVARKQPMSSRQQIALEPTLAEMLTQHLHDGPVPREVNIVRLKALHPDAVSSLEDSVQTVGRCFVRTNQTKISISCIELHDVAQERSNNTRRLCLRRTRRRDRHGVCVKIRQPNLAPEQAAIGVRVKPHASISVGSEFSNVLQESTGLIEQFFGAITAHPFFKLPQVCGIFADRWDRDLMRAPKSLNFLSIYLLRPSPSFWATQNDKRPTR